MSVFSQPTSSPSQFGRATGVARLRAMQRRGLQASETFYTSSAAFPSCAAPSAYTEQLYGIDCPADRITVDRWHAGHPAVLTPLDPATIS
jgi:hypothetical protein